MTSISYLFHSVEDVAKYLEFQAEMNESQARGSDTKRGQTVSNARAVAFRDSARILREAWIDEIDGDRDTSKERGRKAVTPVNAPKIPKSTKHQCEIHTIKDDKPVCVVCGEEMSL